VVVLDNISALSPWLSDALCRAVTGEGRVVRQLYTDTDVNVLRFRRCVVMTSIDAGALRGDLAERLVPLELERINPTHRRTEAEILQRFETEHPRILGELFDLLAAVLEVLPEIHLDELPRMADFARVLAAVDRVKGWNALDRYLGIGTQLAEDVIDADPVARAVIALLDENGRWEGSASELLQRITPENPPKGWPAQPNVLTGALKRAATALREVGIHAEQGVGRTRRTWYLAADRPSPTPGTVTPPSPRTPCRYWHVTVVTVVTIPHKPSPINALAVVARPAASAGCASPAALPPKSTPTTMSGSSGERLPPPRSPPPAAVGAPVDSARRRPRVGRHPRVHLPARVRGVARRPRTPVHHLPRRRLPCTPRPLRGDVMDLDSDADRAALRLLRADLDALNHHLSELDRGTRLSLHLLATDLLERIADRHQPPPPPGVSDDQHR
jgi:hypothetical protein